MDYESVEQEGKVLWMVSAPWIEGCLVGPSIEECYWAAITALSEWRSRR